MLPALPGANDHVTALLVMSVSGVPAVVVGVAGVIAGLLLEAAAAPVPEIAIECGEPLALSETRIVACSALVEDGVNASAIVQLVPTATDVPQFVLSAKSPAFAPLTVIPVIATEAVPELDSTIGCAGLVVPTVWLPKAKLVGLNESTPVPEALPEFPEFPVPLPPP